MWALHWGCIVGILGMGGAVLLMGHQKRLYAAERRRDRRIREEFEAYARFDARLREEDDVRGLARRVCRLVTKKSAFQRMAMLVDDGEGRMYVAGSVGMEEALIEALHEWGERAMGQVQDQETDRAPDQMRDRRMDREQVTLRDAGRMNSRQIHHEMGTRVGARSFAVVLGQRPTEAGCARAIMVPFWTTRGRLIGALAVCADRLLTVGHQAIREVLPPLEALAVKLGRGMENAVPADGRQRSGEPTGPALLAAGIAHALNNPLTSVLGFSELIAETASEPRVRAEAETIAQEARRMRETVQNLLSFSPVVQPHEPVELTALARELAEECEEKLRSRGVRLLVEAEDGLPPVWGDGERLRQLLEHLLNNAAQAIAALDESDGETGQEIRIAVSRDAGWIQMIVSDTGPGFDEPSRVFDPLYTSPEPGGGVGMGLSVCYGIVHEHGGEISAFNLHPHGAALVVELPQADSAASKVPTVAHEVA
jgi:signal transduction histidine kinase